MTILLELSPEQEELLQDAALAKGLTVEGYLLTLIEAIVQPKEPPRSRKAAYTRALVRLFKKSADPEADLANPDKVVRETIRQMRASVLKYKEQAVDAVTTMNMLRKAVDLQEHQIAEKELQALRALAEQQRDQAKRRWQEKTVREKHLEAVKQELIAAIAAADERTRAFRQEEERAQARASQAQMGALKAYEAVMLPHDRIAPLIQALYTEAEWEQKFVEWIVQATQEPSETEDRGDLPAPISVDDAKAFAQKALHLARGVRGDSARSDDECEDAINQLLSPPPAKHATPAASEEDSPPPDSTS